MIKDVQEDGTFPDTRISFEELRAKLGAIRGSVAPDMETGIGLQLSPGLLLASERKNK